MSQISNSQTVKDARQKKDHYLPDCLLEDVTTIGVKNA